MEQTSKLQAGTSPAQPQSKAANGGQNETANQNQLNGPAKVVTEENSTLGAASSQVPSAAKPLEQLNGPFNLATQENVQVGVDGSCAPFAEKPQNQGAEPSVTDPQTHENATAMSTPQGQAASDLAAASPVYGSTAFEASSFPYGPFADLMMDSAFKRAFGDDSGAHGNKQRLLLLLQLILPEKNIVDISYCNTEHISPYLDSKNIRIDVECVTQDGERCIVEMQKLNQNYFSERMVYYSAAAVLSQIPAGQDSYKFMPVYMIAILNFKLNKDHDKVKYEYFIKSDENELMTKNLQFTFIELPNHRDINSPEATRLDKFCWLLRNMSKFRERPDTDGDPLFDLLVESADFTIFTPDDKHNYSENMTTERDIRNQIQYAVEQKVAEAKAEAKEKFFAEGREEGLSEGEKIGEARGKAEGIAEGIEENKLATARIMLSMGYPIEDISKITGLPVETLKDLKHS